jgi:uncharacterized protein
MTQDEQTEIEAAAFRRLLAHLRQHTEVQNIDLMILGDFCRNCLAKWLAAEAVDRGMPFTYEQARDLVYGMPYEAWKKQYQVEPSAEQLARYEEKQKLKL